MNGPHRQRGAATLLIATIMLFSITVAGIYAARSAVTDLRTLSNYSFALQAKNVAEGELDRGLNGLTWDLVATGSDTSYTLIDALHYYYASGKTWPVAAGSARFRLLAAGDFTRVEIEATGSAGSGNSNTFEATRKVYALAKFVATIDYTSPAALTVRNAVSASPSVSLTNTAQDVGIWAGGAVSGGPTVTVSPGAGDGIYPNDTNLQALSPDGFFENFFSESKSIVRGRAKRVDCALGCTATTPEIQALAGQGGLIWIDGDLTLGNAFSFGSSTDPVILIVNGALTLNNPGAEIFGQLYVAGDWNNGSGGGRLVGTAMVEGQFTASGALQFDYDPAVLALTTKDGAYAKVPGSWRDF